MTLVERLQPDIQFPRKGPPMYDWEVSPPGFVLARFREKIIIDGAPCTQARFAQSILITVERQQAYEQEKRGRRMPAAIWMLARITWDALALAEWQQRRPQHE